MSAAPGICSGLWSLWEVLRESAEDFMELGRAVYDAEAIFSMDDLISKGEFGQSVLTLKGEEAVTEELKRLLAVAKKLKLSASTKLLGRRLGYGPLPSTSEEFQVLVEVLKVELEARVFLFVPSHKSSYYEKDNILPEAARNAFPSATQELRQAANAYAFGMHEACVYHAMRGLEHGLRALASEVGLTFDVQMWGTIIDGVQSRIGDMQQHGIADVDKAAKDAHLLFLSQAATQFSYFKDGWRNYVAHAKGHYNEQQALTVMNHVREFMKALAVKLHE